ncbi:hypothetical protein Lfu02_61490 [Longispora fulva]|uniref:Secreted protein n=1 Tax=Longispora fulva TaxID=619741 RepID=A0A8J7G7M9_9ACTN|nr:hypothetical protein [Longispora fulva]MBG6134570.1 hypothetical protein [Longispora fulva]GIG61777.1 hypothetical protein Lfu02_61490 [Longispora fulva]
MAVTELATSHRRAPADRGGVPSRIWALAAVAVLLAVGLLATGASGISATRSGLRVIGHVAGPQVRAGSDLYFALNDMDAQLANALMLGDTQGLGLTRTKALEIYEQRRVQADGDVQQAASLAADDTARKAVTALLNGLGGYEALAARALLLDGQAPHPVGRPAPAALAVYRQATDLMKSDVLPAARQLAQSNAADLTRTYDDTRSAVGGALTWTAVLGGLLLLALLATQIYVGRRFRRTLNPALAAATLAAIVLVAMGVNLFATEGTHLRLAKEDAFDSVLALTQARAVSYDANADESRYLLDPERAARYEQSFFDRTQEIAGVYGTLGTYDDHLARALESYEQSHKTNVPITGYLGAELRNVTFPGERAAADTAVSRYQVYQRDDRRMRAMVVRGDVAGAVAFGTSTRPGDSNDDFDQYDQALVAVTDINQNAFDRAIADGESELSGWDLGLPIGVVLIAAFVLVGVRPRLAEFR